MEEEVKELLISAWPVTRDSHLRVRDTGFLYRVHQHDAILTTVGTL